MITVSPMDSIEPGNPFHSDAVRMGTYIGSNVCVMFMQHTTERQDEIVVVNTATGERLRVAFSDKSGDPA